jgi:hypothetical protein
MTVDYRQLLKDTIRGTIWDCDTPCSPASLNAKGKPIATNTKALAVFWTMVHEIIAEQGGETRPSVARELARLERLDRGRQAGTPTPQRRRSSHAP